MTLDPTQPMSYSNLTPGMRLLVTALLLEHRAVTVMMSHAKPSKASRDSCDAVVSAHLHARGIIIHQAYELLSNGLVDKKDP